MCSVLKLHTPPPQSLRVTYCGLTALTPTPLLSHQDISYLPPPIAPFNFLLFSACTSSQPFSFLRAAGEISTISLVSLGSCTTTSWKARQPHFTIWRLIFAGNCEGALTAGSSDCRRLPVGAWAHQSWAETHGERHHCRLDCRHPSEIHQKRGCECLGKASITRVTGIVQSFR